MIVALDKLPNGANRTYRKRYTQTTSGLINFDRLARLPAETSSSKRCGSFHTTSRKNMRPMIKSGVQKRSFVARYLVRKLLESIYISREFGSGKRHYKPLGVQKMMGVKKSLIGVVLCSGCLALCACTTGGLWSLLNLTGPTGLSTDIGSKAEAIGRQMGGPGGFGGQMMDGYVGHMPQHMGIHNDSNLVGSGTSMIVGLSNESSQDCVFHLSYVTSQMGASEQSMDVSVPAGMDVTIQIPCSEIVGMGPMEKPGQPGCHLADGQPVSNMMSAPGFVGMNYSCGGEYMFQLMADANDLDGDGDHQELIIMSQAMVQFMQRGFPTGMGSMMGGMMGG